MVMDACSVYAVFVLANGWSLQGLKLSTNFWSMRCLSFQARRLRQTRVEYVEEAFLGFISGERFVFEGRLEAVEDHGSLAHGEDVELGEGLTLVGDAVAAEETPVAIPEW